MTQGFPAANAMTALLRRMSTVMVRSATTFVKRASALPTAVVVWTGVLVAANGVIPVFFLGHREAWVILLVFLASAILMMVVSERYGFTRLIGVGHVLWFPLLLYLWTRIGRYPAVEPFGAWIRVVMLINAASLTMDVVDVTRYLKGERDEIVP